MYPEEQSYKEDRAVESSPVDRKTSSLRGSLNELGERVAVLQNRLRPVCRPIIEKVGLVGGENTLASSPSIPKSELSLAIEDLTAQSNIILRNVNQLLDEIDL